jgi:hypothetical protein
LIVRIITLIVLIVILIWVAGAVISAAIIEKTTTVIIHPVTPAGIMRHTINRVLCAVGTGPFDRKFQSNSLKES